MNTLTFEQMHDILVFFNQDFPGKQIRSIRTTATNIAIVTYLDEGELHCARYQYKFEFTANLV